MERCKWDGSSCLELSCTSRMRWSWRGDVTVAGDSSVTDFSFNHSAFCPDLPFTSSSYPAGSFSGTPLPDPDAFDSALGSAERLRWAASAGADAVPFTVDAGLLSDEQVLSHCLTAEQCALPPLLTVVRRLNGSLWQPATRDFSGVGAGTGCCKPSSVAGSSANFAVVKGLPPATNASVWGPVSGVRYSPLPRNASALTAKIFKVFFSFKGTPLYTYVDMTCGARDYLARGGFLGQAPARANGIFFEVMFKPAAKGLPNTHAPMRTDKGIITSAAQFGDPRPRRPMTTTFAFVGLVNAAGGRFPWVSWWQSWTVVGAVQPGQMVASYLHSGLKWATAAAPSGNLPVALLYFWAAQVEFAKLGSRASEIDFSLLDIYGGTLFSYFRPALARLVAVDPATNVSRFAAQALGGSACLGALPASFKQPFVWGAAPPEAGCNVFRFDCANWCARSCRPFWDAIREAREMVSDTLSQETPRCSRCPGLLGVARGNVPDVNPLRDSLPWLPQCLPFQFPDGSRAESPVDLIRTGTRRPSAQPTKQPSWQPSWQPSKAPSQRPSRRPSSAPSDRPSLAPSDQLTERPTTAPSAHPSARPSSAPSDRQTKAPTDLPTRSPSASSPTQRPSRRPSSAPSDRPSLAPSDQLTERPTTAPSARPSARPSSAPSDRQTKAPTDLPTRSPSAAGPTGTTSDAPSAAPVMGSERQPAKAELDATQLQPLAAAGGYQGEGDLTVMLAMYARNSRGAWFMRSEPDYEAAAQPGMLGRRLAQSARLPAELRAGHGANNTAARPQDQLDTLSSDDLGHDLDRRLAQRRPSRAPSQQPSQRPSMRPSQRPSQRPSLRPSLRPSPAPTRVPTTKDLLFEQYCK
jgi:hypothetical protein